MSDINRGHFEGLQENVFNNRPEEAPAANVLPSCETVCFWDARQHGSARWPPNVTGAQAAPRAGLPAPALPEGALPGSATQAGEASLPNRGAGRLPIALRGIAKDTGGDIRLCCCTGTAD